MWVLFRALKNIDSFQVCSKFCHFCPTLLNCVVFSKDCPAQAFSHNPRISPVSSWWTGSGNLVAPGTSLWGMGTARNQSVAKVWTYFLWMILRYILWVKTLYCIVGCISILNICGGRQTLLRKLVPRCHLRLSRFRIQNNLCSYLIFIMNFSLYTTNLLMKGMLVIQVL